MNGFETWRLLTQRFALPGTAQNISLLTKVLEFRFRTDQFEQDYSEWETLKNTYERFTGTTRHNPGRHTAEEDNWPTAATLAFEHAHTGYV